MLETKISVNACCLGNIRLFADSGPEIPHNSSPRITVTHFLFICFSAIMGRHFPNEKWSAFALYRVVMYAGCSVAFAYSEFLCMSTKVYIALGSTCLSTVCYLTFEILTRRQHRLYEQI